MGLSFLLFICFLANYKHNGFLLLTMLTMFVCGSSLGELFVVCCFCIVFLLDVNQGGS